MTITIKDDGVGIDPDVFANRHSLGILGMKERAHLIGADFRICNGDEGGVCIELKMGKSLQLPEPAREDNIEE